MVFALRIGILLLGLFGMESRALAWPPIFGPELTFTNPELIAAVKRNRDGSQVIVSDASLNAYQSLRETYDLMCGPSGGCKIEESSDKHDVESFKILYEDGFWIEIGFDPGVIEVKTRPGTLVEFMAQRSRLQKDLFEALARKGLTPSRTGVGLGHVHIGVESAFGSDEALFRDFVVDFHNHPGLANGAMADDSHNAPSLAELQEGEQKRFSEVIADFDQGKIRGFPKLAKKLQAVFDGGRRFGGSGYIALKLARIRKRSPLKAWTAEVRSINPQQNMDEFIKVIALFQGRIQHLIDRKNKAPNRRVPYMKVRGRALPQEVVTEFHDYVVGAGLDWNDYVSLMRKDLQNLTPERGEHSSRLAALPQPEGPPPPPAPRKCDLRSLLRSFIGVGIGIGRAQ